jgi:hypothetical protein
MFSWSETCSTLEFATRAVGILAKPIIYEDIVHLTPAQLSDNLSGNYRIEALERVEKLRREETQRVQGLQV